MLGDLNKISRLQSDVSTRGGDFKNYIKRRTETFKYLNEHWLGPVTHPSEISCSLGVMSFVIPLKWSPSFIQKEYKTIDPSITGELRGCMNETTEHGWHFVYLILSSNDENKILEIGEMVLENGQYLRDGYVRYPSDKGFDFLVKYSKGSALNSAFVVKGKARHEGVLTNCRNKTKKNQYGFYDSVCMNPGFYEQALQKIISTGEIPEFYLKYPDPASVDISGW